MLAAFAASDAAAHSDAAGQRSLNLSNAVAMTVYEAWRQIGFAERGIAIDAARRGPFAQ